MNVYEIDAKIHILIHDQYGEDERDALLSAIEDGNFEIIGDDIIKCEYYDDDE